MKLTLAIIEMEEIFNAAIDFLKYYSENNDSLVENEDMYDYVQQMLNNERDFIIEEDDPVFVVTDITFENEKQMVTAYSFWDSVYEITREINPELSSVAFEMYYGIIMAYEDQIIGGEI